MLSPSLLPGSKIVMCRFREKRSRVGERETPPSPSPDHARLLACFRDFPTIREHCSFVALTMRSGLTSALWENKRGKRVREIVKPNEPDGGCQNLLTFLLSRIFLLFFPQEMLEYLHSNYLRKWLIRDSNSFVHDEDILLAYRRLAYK